MKCWNRSPGPYPSNLTLFVDDYLKKFILKFFFFQIACLEVSKREIQHMLVFQKS